MHRNGKFELVWGEILLRNMIFAYHCTLIHGYIKAPNLNFVFLLQSMPYDVKIVPHQMKTVIYDENLHKLSFFETC